MEQAGCLFIFLPVHIPACYCPFHTTIKNGQDAHSTQLYKNGQDAHSTKTQLLKTVEQAGCLFIFLPVHIPACYCPFHTTIKNGQDAHSTQLYKNGQDAHSTKTKLLKTVEQAGCLFMFLPVTAHSTKLFKTGKMPIPHFLSML